MAVPLLQFEAVSAGYLDDPIVRDFSASIPAGSITTVIGGNGAGKSTLLKAVYGLNRCFAGSIRFKGEAIEQLTPQQRMQRGIGFVPQGRCNFALMSVRENLALGGYTLGRAQVDPAIERVLTLFPMLAGKLKVMAGNLSGGEQQILETAMVLVTQPTLLLLDEPSLGLSPASQDQIFALMQSLRDSGLTVFVVEQNAHGCLEVSDTAIVMELGRLFMMSPARDVMANPHVKAAYLGGAPEADTAVAA